MRKHSYYKGDIFSIITNGKDGGITDNFPRGWQSPVNHVLNDCLYQLTVKNKNLKHRIEHPYFSFYTVTEQELDHIITQLEEFQDKIIEISAPHKDNIDYLKNDVLLVKKIPVQYGYKIVIKGGIGTEDYIERRRHLNNYLYNLGNEIYRYNLNFPVDRYYYNNTYFYCTDDKIVTLLQLAYPDLIGKTFRVVKV